MGRIANSPPPFFIMTPAQELHLQEIITTACRRLEAKYRRGQEEHGGDLWDRPVLNDATDEVIDLLTYLHTARSQRDDIYQTVIQARNHLSRGEISAVEEALDFIHHLTRPA